MQSGMRKDARGTRRGLPRGFLGTVCFMEAHDFSTRDHGGARPPGVTHALAAAGLMLGLAPSPVGAALPGLLRESPGPVISPLAHPP